MKLYKLREYKGNESCDDCSESQFKQLQNIARKNGPTRNIPEIIILWPPKIALNRWALRAEPMGLNPVKALKNFFGLCFAIA